MIRDLAAHLYSWEPGTDLTFDSQFVLSLDAGTDDDDPAKLVTSYHNQWWSAPTAPPTEELLSSHNIAQFLEHHRQFTPTAPPVANPLTKPSYTWSRGVNIGSAPPKLDCDRCRLYRAITISALDDLRDLRHQVHAFEVRYASNASSTARRAADFHQLYEASLLKNAPQRPGPSKRVPPLTAEQVRARAQKEMARLENLPKLKWTSGLPLSSQEVLEALKPHRHSGRVHSGYVSSLPAGSWGEDSIVDDTPFPNDADWYSDTATSQAAIPELSPGDIPIHFTFPPLRHLYSGPPRLGPESEFADDDDERQTSPSPRAAFLVPDPPSCALALTHPVSDARSTSSVSSEEVGAAGCFPVDQASLGEVVQTVTLSNRATSDSGSNECRTSSVSSEEVNAIECFPAATRTLPHASSASAVSSAEVSAIDCFPDEGPPLVQPSRGDIVQSECLHSRSDSGSGAESAMESDCDSEGSSEAGPNEVFPDVNSPLSAFHDPHATVSQSHVSSDADTDSDSVYEVSATEAAAALADSDDNLGVGGMVLAALIGGQLAVETDPAQSDPSPDEVPAGPFTAEWFAPLNLDALCESSDESESD